ncbi:MAG: hypothetical protein ACFB6S_19500 [Geminicoccaceae bacterium]
MSPDRKSSYEVHVLEGTRWTIIAVFTDGQEGRQLFSKLSNSGRYRGVRLVKEFYISTNTMPHTTIVRDTTAPEAPVIQVPSQQGSRRAVVGPDGGAKLAKHARTSAAKAKAPPPKPAPRAVRTATKPARQKAGSSNLMTNVIWGTSVLASFGAGVLLFSYIS